MFKRSLLAISVLALNTGVALAQSSPPPLATPPATADSSAPRYDRREVHEHNRIKDGVENGSLTPREARRLRTQQDHIKMTEERAEKDGTVTKKEERHLERMQDRASEGIYKQKHDKQGTMAPTPQRP